MPKPWDKGWKPTFPKIGQWDHPDASDWPGLDLSDFTRRQVIYHQRENGRTAYADLTLTQMFDLIGIGRTPWYTGEPDPEVTAANAHKRASRLADFDTDLEEM